MIQSTVQQQQQRARTQKMKMKRTAIVEPAFILSREPAMFPEYPEGESTKMTLHRSVTMRPQSQMSDFDDDGEGTEDVKIEFFTNQTFKDRLKYILMKNRKTAIAFRLCNLLLKSLSAVVYVLSLIGGGKANLSRCYGCEEPKNVTYPNLNSLIWLDRGLNFYILQTFIAYLSFLETLLLLYLEYRGNIWEQILSTKILFESVCSLPFIVSVANPKLINLYVPSFLNCWLARQFLEAIVILSMKTSSSLTKHLVNLLSFIFCLGFTCVCGLNYLERTQDFDGFDLMNSFWFVTVTFSTVGYGDITPTWWLSKLFVMLTICLALILVPVQVEQISFVFAEHQKTGGTYSRNRAEKEKHVVLVTTTVTEELVRDFVSEFYAYTELQDYYVLLLSAAEYDTYIKTICENPACLQRVIYIQGSALRFDDLVKVKMHYAECCFILASRHAKDQQREDEATILRAWSVNDFAPHCPLFVQILAPESKVHVQFADYVICEDELKYALMASNCICPAMSTYISLLVHTLEGRDVSRAKLEWERLFGRSTAQEIYDKKVCSSKFFSEFVGCTFTYAAMVSHRRYGCMLIGVRPHGKKIILNPGPSYILSAEDTCYFLSITCEEETNIIDSTLNKETNTAPDPRRVSENISRLQNKLIKKAKSRLRSNADSGYSENSENSKFADVVEAILNDTEEQKKSNSINLEEIDQGYPTPAYQWFIAPICHLMKENKPSCCLDLFKPCEHCPYTNALEYDFPNKPIIISVESVSVAIANFIVPLRHHLRPVECLSPIIVLTETRPDINVLAAVSCYPEVYYCLGKIGNLNDLFRAGISEAKALLVADRESSKSASEMYLADSSSIVCVQTINKLFPNLMIISELTYPTNMKFLDFVPKENAPRNLSFQDKRMLEKVPVDSDLFRSAFMSGQALSPSMLDTLLYQSFVKPYIMSIVYLLIGLKQHSGSGHLIFHVIDKEDVRQFESFGKFMADRLMEHGELPIGMYRIQQPDQHDNPVDVGLEGSCSGLNQTQGQEDDAVFAVRQNQAKIILRDRLLRLGVADEDLNLEEMDKRRSGAVKYVVVNPEYEIQLQEGDIIYLIQPPTMDEGCQE